METAGVAGADPRYEELETLMNISIILENARRLTIPACLGCVIENKERSPEASYRAQSPGEAPLLL